ncbi:MAG TPA: helix-turn-helix domain-containing protein [Calditrichaeota bacterium]|nr:helix-turn-helix domain-containing protein [Calditrichota bacterium]
MRNNLKRQRLVVGQLTQQNLAERAGVSRQTIIAIEKGSFNPSVKLAKILSTNVEELLILESKD